MIPVLYSVPEEVKGILSGECPFPILKVWTAKGQASFPMKRGSFRYQDRIREARVLYSGKTEKTEEAVPAAGERDSAAGSREYCLEVRLPEDRNRIRLSFRVPGGEHYYGFGETFSELDLRGQKVRIWVAEHQNAKRIARKMIREKFFGKQPNHKSPFSCYESYYAQPSLTSSNRYYIHSDTGAYAAFDLRKDGIITLELRESCRLYFGFSSDFTGLSELLSARIGRQEPPPSWCSDGMIFGIQGGPGVIEEKLRKLRDAGVPIAGIWSQDWCGCRRTGFGYQVMWNWRFDGELYPDLPEKIRSWKEQGIRFLGYINPFLALEKELYAEASEKGYCVKDRKGADYLVTITTFPAAMIDLTNPEAREWYKKIIKENMIGIGMSGWMADFGEYLPADCVLYSGEDPEKVHNSWPARWAELNREAVAECGLSDEILFFTRAGHTGTVKASRMMWTGDQHVDWSRDDGIGSVIPATLSLSMSSFGLTHSDTGGYTTIMNMTRERELFMRWAEMNAFSPLMRSHEGNQPGRNVQFDGDPEMLSHLSRFVRIFVSLKPYLREAMEELRDFGTPVMRPLFYHYEEEAACTEKFEYLLGRDILVCPVIEKGSRKRTCYLPDDSWIHFFSGEKYRGGQLSVDAPLGVPPVFVREERYRAFQQAGIVPPEENKTK